MIRSLPFIIFLVIVMNVGLLFETRYVNAVNLNKSKVTQLDLNDGDLIMRNGRGLVSSWFRQMSLRDKRYTHSGLIRKKGNNIFVIHCYQDAKLPGLIEEPFEDFISSSICENYATYRYDLTTQEYQKLRNKIDLDLKSKVSFDDSFELNNGNKRYCTEWIATCLNEVTSNQCYIPVTILKDFNYFAPDNLYLNSHTHLHFTKSY